MSPVSATVPRIDLVRVSEAQLRFETALTGVDDAALRRPSLLPGWSVAHVLAHVVRNDFVSVWLPRLRRGVATRLPPVHAPHRGVRSASATNWPGSTDG